VFSPNGDGANDVWKIQYDGDEAFVVEVFDRWGVKYFESRNRNQGWDGRDLNGNLAVEGTYFYVLQIGKGNYTGSLSIIR
jgi:gliding motility-associated-like protein